MTRTKQSAKPQPKSLRRALRALRQLIEHPEQVQLAFEVVDALDGGSIECGLRRMLNEPEGRRVFAERLWLRAYLCDRESLESLPDGSLGRAYLAHLERFDLKAEKLVEVNAARVSERRMKDPALLWYSERSELMHDLWHVLTGYGADHLGEAALLPFNYAQKGGLGYLILTLGATVEAVTLAGPRWLITAWRSWRRGRRAICLEAQPYELLLELPLEEVRRLRNIEPAEHVHTEGLRTGNRGEILVVI